MKPRLVLQPYADQACAHDVLTTALRDARYDVVWMASAWVRRSGLQQLQPALDDFIAAGGTAYMVTGVSMTGATEQGLRAVVDTFPNAYVFHQPGRTFHPKVSLFSGAKDALAVIGSSNLTAGGLASNWEANVGLELDLTSPEDAATAEQVRVWYRSLIDDSGACRPLDEAMIQTLLADPAVNIGDEDVSASSSTSVASSSQQSTFAASSANLRGHLRSPAGSEVSTPPPTPATVQLSSALPSASSGTASVVHRWSKKLPAADAQRLVGSSPSNTVALTQADAVRRIDQATWFRDTLFSQATWVKAGGYEHAFIDFETKVHGKRLGAQRLEIRQTPRFESGQNNRAASLHWSGALATEVRQRNMTGDFITLESLSDGTFRLTISASRLGPVVV